MQLPLNNSLHTFHIPVMGIAFTIDTPIRVAHWGINSALSIMDDLLIEQMREHYNRLYEWPHEPISTEDPDYRAKRIQAYLEQIKKIIHLKSEKIRTQVPTAGPDFIEFLNYLPPGHIIRRLYSEVEQMNPIERAACYTNIQNEIRPGRIEVNIMTKLDKGNRDKAGNPLPPEFNDAMAALRGFASSSLEGSVIFSAGMNPRLFAYICQFEDFFPDTNGNTKKEIIIKVSDFRSAAIQGKFLAKKGIRVAEFRIESGLNCGGHAFATEGLLMGPILESFKNQMQELQVEIDTLCREQLAKLNKPVPEKVNPIRVTFQGGVGTAEEHSFILKQYNLNSVGWGSPFLLVPDATIVDDETRQNLAKAKPEDYYLSHASPLGVPFNNFKPAKNVLKAKDRIESGKPGSPCIRKLLVSNTEFTDEPICTASIQYQKHKRKQIQESDADPAEKEVQLKELSEKECLCEGLCAPARLQNALPKKGHYNYASICPGPNLAFFSGTFTLSLMLKHIYGEVRLLNTLNRPNVMINEMKLYVSYLEKELIKGFQNKKPLEYIEKFVNNLMAGIQYYREQIPQFKKQYPEIFENMEMHLNSLEKEIHEIMMVPVPVANS